MRPPIHRRAAGLLASALAGAALAWAPAPAVAAQCPHPADSCIVVSVVETVDGRTTVVDSQVFKPADLEALAAQDLPLQERQYALRENPAPEGGQIDTPPIAQGSRVSINVLLADVDPALPGSATYLEMPDAAGVPAVLSDADLVDPETSADYPFLEKLEPAVFTRNGRVGYIRPLRDAEDTNASDYFEVTGRLDITVHTTGTLLAPKVLSSKGTKLTTEDKTTFWATYAAGPGTAITTIVWDFGDGSAEGTTVERPTKSYAEPGTYPVVVTVRTTDGSYGRSSATEITVDQAPPPPKAPPPKAPRGGTGDGDGRSGDGGSGGGGGDSGGGGSGGGGSGDGDSGGGSLPPLDDLPGFDFEDPDFTDPDFEDPDFSSPDFEEPPVELDDVEPPAPVDDGLDPVEGYALSGDEILPGTPEAIPGTETSTASDSASSESLRTRVATWAVAAAAAALLIGVGALGETRWFRDRLRHLRRRA